MHALSKHQPQHCVATAARAALLALACTAAAASACARQEPVRRSVLAATVHARSTDGQHVAGVRLWADGRELGTTDGEGQLTATLDGGERARVVVTAACPSAFRTLDERRELVVRPLSAAVGEPAARGLQLTVTCEPLELLAALVVRVRGDSVGGLPLRVGDRVVGQTAPDGTAHLVLRSRPDASLTVVLDTSGAHAVEPKNPVQTFQLGREPSVLLFEQSLERPRRAHRLGHSSVVQQSTRVRTLPYRVH